MDRADDGDGDVTGLSLSEAAERIAGRDGRPDAETVRTVLAEVAVDRVVSEDGVTELVSDASMAVSNACDRAEFAVVRADDVADAAADAPALDTVRVRLDSIESRAESVESRSADLTARLQATLDSREDGLYEYVRDLRDLRGDADALHGAAQQLATDVDEFERWLDGHDARVSDLEADVGAVEGALADLEAAADGLVDPEPVDGDAPDPATRWFATTQRQRVNGLVLADARAELADLRTWADREGADTDRLDGLDDRLDDLEADRERLGERLADLARPDWRDRYGAALDATEATLAAFDPPVDFGAVQAALEERVSV